MKYCRLRIFQRWRFGKIFNPRSKMISQQEQERDKSRWWIAKSGKSCIVGQLRFIVDQDLWLRIIS